MISAVIAFVDKLPSNDNSRPTLKDNSFQVIDLRNILSQIRQFESNKLGGGYLSWSKLGVLTLVGQNWGV